jgi:phage terminase large subunit-like protein
MRIGEHPRQLVTTTPRPIPVIRELLADEGKPKGTYVTRGSTYDNSANLARTFIQKMERRYQGTRLGRQELMAEILDDVPGALWTRRMLDRRSGDNPLGAGVDPGAKLPRMHRIVVGVDPSGTSGEDDGGDLVGIVVAGKGDDGYYYVLEDGTCDLGPAGWGRRVVELYDQWGADCVVAESNYGGAMVEFTVRTVDRNTPYKEVKAARGKHIRAEPIASLYEQGRVRHAGSLSELEDQLCNFTRSGYLGTGSPDRADALVWCLTELALAKQDYDPEMWAKLVND